MVLSVSDVLDQVPDEERGFFRKLQPTERFAMMGFPPNIVVSLGEQLAGKASGNAYPTQLIIASLCPMVRALGMSSLDLASWPSAPVLDCADIDQKLKLAKRLLDARDRIVDKKKHDKSLGGRHKRSRSSSS